ncbi:ribosome small subunit-dependent GTPase A [Desulfomicrobium baculatum]|uniref:Small ribosomal subunit biogenesis GTPase RsgA n=1 Tax=Desulfomicrobium baculatum (strain DSM 4028 / VKM B-1378 / X) TaxID=525897 RepID=C7LX51_DESBD|nr:ribosome small subunit-dependent GTPase A [Desulfomicrobium baculatum]ACU88724.1 GTPase EngC [Desulfomicrobium baculatum DSM 4028]
MIPERLGFDPWFAAHAPESQPEGCAIARVCAVDRSSYCLRNESGDVPAELSGKLLYQSERTTDLPSVGDWVAAQYYDQGRAAIIHQVFPRKTFLRRRAAGGRANEQMIAANVDMAFIVQSGHFDFNPNRLERYLIMAADGQVEPIVLLTKTDLLTEEELEHRLAIIASVTTARIIALSSVTGAGLGELRGALAPGKTCCLLGSSGVGKTTLVNRLMGLDAYATRAVSATGEGTHTTTRRQLILLESGAMLIDTPGMRELGILGAGDCVDMGFGEMAALASDCRYADCTHRHEPGCAVRAAIERGDLEEERYASYLKLKKEAEFNEMSSLDKRKKDKAFGRLVKSVKKGMKG